MYVNLLFWYQFFCGFSGSVMSNSWVLILFNLTFTSVPPLIYGVLDQDMSPETLMAVPELYWTAQNSKVTADTQAQYTSPSTLSQKKKAKHGASHAVSGAVVNTVMPNTPVCLQVYVPRIFWITVLDAFYQSLVCFFVPYFVSSFFHTRMYMYFGFWWRDTADHLFCEIISKASHAVQLLSNLRCLWCLFQALAGSDVSVLSLGSPINTSALFIILLHQVIESHTLVRHTADLTSFRIHNFLKVACM